ncbi:hypothetical protein Rhopal_002096-T1 [Rhodotorula paludigena]|uniref:Right handed beta helix domain-containing protein n=1 Tax=Rhodotorula paludigena TaxID=86838 RepID=A0AAV5GJ88_9BASI|nr:hypothetical protein Rhopal_002096-T1 [Rhodotorula paludigena]
MIATAGQIALAAALFASLASAAPAAAKAKASPTLSIPYSRHTPSTAPTLRLLPVEALNHVWDDKDVPSLGGDDADDEGSMNSTSLATRSLIASEEALAARHLFAEDFADGSSIRARSFDAHDEEQVVKRSHVAAPVENAALLAKRRRQIRAACLDSTATDVTISSLFYYGGANTTVYLCQSATIATTGPVFFTAANQVLTTFGNPTGAIRATIRVTGSDQACAIYGVQAGADRAILRNVQVDGARPALGRTTQGLALIEMGGNTQGQQVTSVHAYEPRGWSALHTAEGTNLVCSGMLVSGNQIGPAGQPPPTNNQFPDDASWADGISHACKSSQVTNNLITDVTDGGIVIFGAPGSLVQGNTINSVSRQLLGGINMVDWSPFSGSFEGTVVQGNNLLANTAFMKIGIAIGGLSWGGDNRTEARTYGGTVQNNYILAGTNGGGYMEFGISVAGHRDAVIKGNTAKRGRFGGTDTSYCFPDTYPLPPPGPFVRDPYTTPGVTVSPASAWYQERAIVFAICRGPGPVTVYGSAVKRDGLDEFDPLEARNAPDIFDGIFV